MKNQTNKQTRPSAKNAYECLVTQINENEF